jgi:FkbM family methyltransferase
MHWIQRVERLIEGTPLEPWARRFYRKVHSIGRPRSRQSLRYHRQTVQIMARVLTPGSSCVIVGAHRGSLLEEVVRLAPKGQHFAYEPLPDLAARLTRRFPKVRVYQVAVSDVSGESPFFHVVDQPGYSGLRRLGSIPSGMAVHEIVVRTEPLDDLLPADLPIAFMKIAVGGAQLQVLEGAEHTIERWRPLIVFEHGTSALLAYGTSSAMMWDLLVGRYGLRISRPADWLARKRPLTAAEFEASVGFHAGSEFCFLAHL